MATNIINTFTTPNRPLTWLITGCSSGLGLALVRHIQRQDRGHRVIATSRNPSKTPELVDEVGRKGGRWLKLDVDDLDSSTLIDDLESSQGYQIDVLVNNAGYSVHNAVEHFTEGEVRAMMDTLYFGPSRLMRAVLPHMRARRFGVIVNISSGAGLEGRESMGAYAAAKAALDGVTKVLAKEVAPFNVRAIYVPLGALNTGFGSKIVVGKNYPMNDDYTGSAADHIMSSLGGGSYRMDGDPDKAANVVYEVIVGEGVGKGKEGERVLPLGRDLAVRVKQIVDQWNHTMEVFGHVCNNVYVDDN
ncbi:hypothetical protein QBC46DRAFT_433354 [Diplogelasinospora grovesii]|uniref:Ketoreductase domain-containing protein n=1 Tax=Diplogelasinospora grovesii TaxID=303347 RepID=A0AAN6NG94_9PEZI|nr:hypothetical protein QBC46DRAFT_433354 [Diplogelasinospora grovesii]